MPHRTWSLLFSTSQGGSYIQLTEVAFLDAAGNDLSVGGIAGASTIYSAAYDAASAFDKNAATDWCNASGVFPARLWYTHPAPVDVRGVRIHCASNTSWLPRGAGDLSLSYSDDFGATWRGALDYRLAVTAGSFTAGATVEVSATYAPVTYMPVSLPGYIQGRAPARYSALAPVPALGPLRGDYRHRVPATGVISDRVMFKATPSSPESPFAMGRVWLLRLADGFKAWEGWSNVTGHYTATGLEVGVDYIAVGIDPARNHKATGAGPVRAVEAP